ncbi:3-hydroxyisobutyryl-CoA hydrolase [Coemansia sp. RSA 376]|nr:3-hydroxyisobutyryl-CoA hydrolase [Coemansia sp. RSA 455]KAJ2260643.1 3-hydroxyisobutyryl-CoA hydrolase [Coemansia sp. RSA 376]
MSAFVSRLSIARKASAVRGFQQLLRPTTISSISRHMMSTKTDADLEGDRRVLTLKNLMGRSLILNRPEALNALTHPMVLAMKKHLLGWQKSDLCNVVILRSNSPRAFCAGGDVVRVSSEWESGNQRGAMQFFWDEYSVNHLIASYEKPVVALLDGYTMGGGVGLSVHAAFRVATESTVFAMPETKIGFFPDVGATFFLPRMDGQTGVYLGLTGQRLKGRDLVYAGVATHFVPSERLPMLEKRLQEIDVVDYDVVNRAIEEFVAQPEAGQMEYSLAGVRDAIDRCFRFNKVESIVEALRQETEAEGVVAEWAARTLEQLMGMSPSSLKLTLEQLRKGRTCSIQESFALELRLAERRLSSHDMHEGIQALLVRKSNDPQWQPSTIDAVDMQKLHAEYFETRGNYEMQFLDPANFEEYPHSYGLPSEKEVGEFVRGENPQAGDFGLTRNEVVAFFVKGSGHKIGVKEKVNWVLDRKTRLLPDSSVLQWIK